MGDRCRRRQIRAENPVDVLDLLTVDEVADLLRTTRKAIYAMNDRRQLPGVVRVGTRLLVDRALLLEWLRQKRAPSLKE